MDTSTCSSSALRKSGRSTELCEAAVVMAWSPRCSSPLMTTFRASVTFAAKMTRFASGALKSVASALRHLNTVSPASSDASCTPRPMPPKSLMAAATASATCGGFMRVVAALSK